MIFFLKKSRNIMLAAAAVLFLIVIVWRYGQGGNHNLQAGFKPVNEQMQQMIDQGKEQAPVRSFSEKPSSTPKSSSSPKPSKSESKPSAAPKAFKEESEPATNPDASKSESNPTASPKASKSESKSAITPKSSKSTSSSITPSSIPKSAAAHTTDKIDLNTATLEQLDALPGIGESKAKAILAYRQEKGSFTKIEQLLEIKGIGEKMLAVLRSSIYIGQR